MQTLRGWWKGSSDSLSQVYMSAHALTLSGSLHFDGHVLKNTQRITQEQTSRGKSWHVITFLCNLGKKWSPARLWDYWWLHEQAASCSDLPGQRQPQALPWKLHDILRDQLDDIFLSKREGWSGRRRWQERSLHTGKVERSHGEWPCKNQSWGRRGCQFTIWAPE